MRNLIYLNGELVEPRGAQVPLLDRGYLYGEGLFETMRAYAGRVFALDRHLRRLLSSARDLGLQLGIGEEALAESLAVTLRANELSDAYLRLTVSQQCDAAGIESRAPGRFTISIIARELGPSTRSRPVDVSVLEPGSAPAAALARHKTLSFLAYVCARAEARVRHSQDALLVNAAGEITEASTANVFFVIDGGTVTPPVACGLLPGITRELILELACDQGIDVVQRPVQIQELAACSECFLSNSIVELQPVARVDGRLVGSGDTGPVWSALSAAYTRATATASAD